MFHIGSQWRDQKQQPDLVEEERTLQLDISGANVEQGRLNTYLRYAGEPSSDREDRLEAWQEAEGIRCVLTHDREGLPILIPSTELLRFYYTQSARLTLAILGGKLRDIEERKQLFNEEASGALRNGHYLITLNKATPDGDAWVLARLAASPHAMKQALNIADSLAEPDPKVEARSPQVNFPFEGPTDLSVRGKVVKSQGQEYFLVQRILFCSGGLPYENIVIAGKNWIVRLFTGRIDVETGEPVPPRRRIKEVLTRVTNRFRPATSGHHLIEVDHNHTRFTPVADKKAKKRSQKIYEFGAAETPKEEAEPEPIEGSVDPPGDEENNDTRPVEVDGEGQPQEDKEPIAANLDNAREALELLARQDAFEVTYRPIYPENEQTDLSTFAIRLGKRDVIAEGSKWCIIGKGRTPRKALIAEITFRNGHFYFFENERTEDEEKVNSGRAMVGAFPLAKRALDAELRKIMVICANNYGGWLELDDYDTVKNSRVNHNAGSTENMSRRIERKVRKLARATDRKHHNS